MRPHQILAALLLTNVFLQWARRAACLQRPTVARQRARERPLGGPRAAERVRDGERVLLDNEDLSRQHMISAVMLRT